MMSIRRIRTTPTSPITLDAVRSLFPRAAITKDGYLAFCPVHEDPHESNPSLVVSWNPATRKTLVLCRSQGCSNKSIAKKLGLRGEVDLYRRLEGSSNAKAREKRQTFKLVAPARPLDVDLSMFPLASDTQLARLAEDRDLPLKAFQPWAVRWNVKTQEYLFPVRTPDGTLTDLRRYRIPTDGTKNPVKSWPGAKIGLWGGEQLSLNKTDQVYICAGEWDAIAMRWLLRKLERSGVVLGLPGELSFQESWARHFKSRDVHSFNDNDDAGKQGELKIADALTEHARQVSYTHWPETLPKGWDVRDWIITGALHKRVPQACYDNLMAMQRPYPRLRPALSPDIDRIFQQQTFARTDAGNAEYVVKRHGTNLRWHTQYKAWLHWQDDDGSWRALVEPPFQLVTEAMRERAKHAALSHDEDEAEWARDSESQHRMSSSLAIARSYTGLQVTVENWNRNPDLLAVANGVVDLRTGELREHRREDYISFRCPHPYDADAECPRWTRFLREVFKQHHRELIPWIQRAVGYSLTGHTREHCFFMPYGDGRNGKSTLLNTVSYALGGPSISTDDYKKLRPTHPGYAHVLSFTSLQKRQHGSEPYELAGLPGRRFVSLAEAEKGARFNEATLKRWTGGDPIVARAIYGSPMTFVPVAKFWIAVNDLPGTDDHSEGFWSRVRVIPFIERFDLDTSLQDTLYQEAPGVLAWAIRGAVTWFKRGLGTNAIVQRATTEYRSDADPLTEFVRDACDEHADAVALLKHLNDAYQKWAAKVDIRPTRRWSRLELSRALRQKFERTTKAGPDRDQVGFKGLSVKSDYRLKPVKA